MNVITMFGLVATITSFVGLMPQVYKIYKTKSAHDVSMIMLYNYLICSISWIGYGIYTSSEFVVYSNIVGFLTSLISIFQKRYYDSA
ncbi:MAG: SemiSWEET family transporter [Rickettsiales bacterium]|nr:SemiSWEET family transporter [Rickettsiales bacterium]